MARGWTTKASEVGRGVWIAPWLGKNRETVLVSVRRDGCIVEQRELGSSDDHIGAADAMWDRLEVEDPAPLIAIMP